MSNIIDNIYKKAVFGETAKYIQAVMETPGRDMIKAMNVLILYFIAKLFNNKKFTLIIAAAFITCGFVGYCAYFVLYVFLCFFKTLFDGIEGFSSEDAEVIERIAALEELRRVTEELEQLDKSASSGEYTNIYVKYAMFETYSISEIRNETARFKAMLRRYEN